MLIGLAGFKRSGKDTVARALGRTGFVRMAFADAVRQEVFARYPQAQQVADADKERPQDFLGGRSLRDLLIECGQGRRDKDPDYWVNVLRDGLDVHLREGRSVVVSDVRMLNEVAMLREYQAKMVWVTRPGVTSNGHATEQDLELLCDIVLNNDGAPSHLEKQAVGLLAAPLCGRCKHFKADRSFSRYGFCGAAQGSIEQKARLLDIFDDCTTPNALFTAAI